MKVEIPPLAFREHSDVHSGFVVDAHALERNSIEEVENLRLNGDIQAGCGLVRQ